MQYTANSITALLHIRFILGVRSVCIPILLHKEKNFKLLYLDLSIGSTRVVSGSGVPRNFFRGGGFNKFS